jgi:hypothetical protein
MLGGCEREKNSARPIDNTFHVYDNQITAELRESDRICSGRLLHTAEY